MKRDIRCMMPGGVVFAGHKAKQATKAYEDALQQWMAQATWYKGIIETARGFKGTGSSELVLGSGEAAFYKVTGAGLVEDRRQAGHYEGRSSGVSVPIGPVRYRVGQSKGHYVQGASIATDIDTGTVYITNRRVVFQGAKQTRECSFAKLIGFRHDEAKGTTTLSVSNRQKPTTVRYGPGLSAAFKFRLDLALADYRGTVNELVARLVGEANDFMTRRPLPPAAGH
jgi:hypothetical protein